MSFNGSDSAEQEIRIEQTEHAEQDRQDERNRHLERAGQQHVTNEQNRFMIIGSNSDVAGSVTGSDTVGGSRCHE